MTDKPGRDYAKQLSHDEIDLQKIIAFLIDRIRTIVIMTVVFALAGVAYALLSIPVYHADALIQVEPEKGDSVMYTLSQLLPAETPISEREIQLITSRTLLSQTVSQLNLDTQVEFNDLPILGRFISRFIRPDTPQLTVKKFETTNNAVGDRYTLEYLGGNKYRLATPSGTITEGVIGTILKTPEFNIEVTHIRSEIGEKFTLKKLDVVSVISELQKIITIRDRGKDTGLLTISINGTDPEKIRNIVQKVSENYAEQSIKRKAEQAEKSLGFLKTQLPLVRSHLDMAETKLNKYRSINNTVDLTLEAKSMLESMVQLDGQINQLILKETEISKRYTKQHPAYAALQEKIQVLEEDKYSLAKRVDKLPLTQQEILRLTRDVQSGQIIYMQLLDKEQELNISRASTIGAVRIIDSAITDRKPVNPGKLLIIVTFACMGFVSSVVWIVAKMTLVHGVDSAEMLEDAGLNVLSNIPLSRWQKKHDHLNAKNVPAGGLLATENPLDSAVEALKNLRTGLHFSMLEARSNILMISGASAKVGKTFLSSNLAAVITQADRTVLYIDADMRRGYAHRIFGKPNKTGLSDVLSGAATVEQAIQKTDIEGLDIITRGTVPDNPSELLLRTQCAEMLKWASVKYDVVVVDVPPVLAVTDAVIIGQHAGVSILVARFEMSTVREMESSIHIFARHNVNINGVVLNAVINRASGHYNYGKHAYYKYESVKN